MLLTNADVIVRRTFLIPLVKIVLLECVFLISFFFLLEYLNQVSDAPLKSGGILVFLFLQSLQFFWCFMIAAKWFFYYYTITENELRAYNGIVFQTTKSYSLSKIESLELKQGILGRIFRFGTITVEMYMSELKIQVCLRSIMNPKKYYDILEKSLAKDE